MNQYIEKLMSHLSERKSSGTRMTGEDLLEQLPLKHADRVFDVVCGQCSLYQRQAFLDGLMLGAGLHRAMTGDR